MNTGKSDLKYIVRQKRCSKKVSIILYLCITLTLNYMLLDTFAYAQSQRVAPGVNPNKYQPEPPVAQPGKITE